MNTKEAHVAVATAAYQAALLGNTTTGPMAVFVGALLIGDASLNDSLCVSDCGPEVNICGKDLGNVTFSYTVTPDGLATLTTSPERESDPYRWAAPIKPDMP